ncbi:MAG: M23 family metallopeptidase, partial [Planctomycetes bacterium]|nr:M23 family metallopeptidase [Planctomycetota bacterium]
PAPVMLWGNLVAIEHRLEDGAFVTTIYGHLDTNRLVKAGDIVTAGQPIGTIGREHPQINGGYRPHLHFGIREGRMAERGRVVLPLSFPGGTTQLRIAKLNEDELELEPAQPLPPNLSDFRLPIGDVTYEFRRTAGGYVVPSRLLWSLPTTPDFPLIGYDTSTDGWLDPVKFLRRHKADRDPAPYRLP